MDFSKEFVNYLKSNQNYTYSGWVINDVNDINNHGRHIEWCSISLPNNIIITIRQDDKHTYNVAIHNNFLINPETGSPSWFICESKLVKTDLNDELIKYLKSKSSQNRND